MKKILAAVFIMSALFACEPAEQKVPEPHLLLGQRITFVGCEPDETYVIVGYKEQFDGDTQKDWNEQEYVVFVYMTQQNEMKEGTIHINSIVKK